MRDSVMALVIHDDKEYTDPSYKCCNECRQPWHLDRTRIISPTGIGVVGDYHCLLPSLISHSGLIHYVVRSVYILGDRP